MADTPTPPNLFDPLNWPVPEPRRVDKSPDDGVYVCACECGHYVHWVLDPSSLDRARRAYVRHYYREHAYRNWSA